MKNIVLSPGGSKSSPTSGPLRSPKDTFSREEVEGSRAEKEVVVVGKRGKQVTG
jgi:hypothetical protein